MKEAVGLYRVAGSCFGSMGAQRAGRLVLSLFFKAVLGVQRIFHFDSLTDTGFALLTGGLRILSRRCFRIARPPRAPFTYANTRRLAPYLTQVNTSKSVVLHRLVQHRPLRPPPPVRPPALLHLLLPSHTLPGHTLLSASHGVL